MNYPLSRTGGTDILTTFRFEIHIAADPANTILGLAEDVTGYIQRCDLPAAPGDPITWHLPGGMKNFQAGKRTVRQISTEFVVPTTAGYGSIYSLLENLILDRLSNIKLFSLASSFSCSSNSAFKVEKRSAKLKSSSSSGSPTYRPGVST